MFASASPSEAAAAEAAAQRRLLSIRARAGVRVEAHRIDGRTRLAGLAEHGGYRAKFPDVAGDGLEAVIINTGGGVVGGDRITFEACAQSDAVLTVTSSTAERVYRSSGSAAAISVRLDAMTGSTLAWVPQPTILFSQSRFERRLEADVASDARLLIAESTVFGRIASGETMGEGQLRDSWRVQRDGRPVFADASRLHGSMQQLLERPAIAAGARCAALMLFVAPESEDRLDAVREAVASLDASIGVSAWNGQLVLRALATRLEVLQTAIRRAVTALGTVAVPASWSNGHD